MLRLLVVSICLSGPQAAAAEHEETVQHSASHIAGQQITICNKQVSHVSIRPPKAHTSEGLEGASHRKLSMVAVARSWLHRLHSGGLFVDKAG